MKKAEEWMYLSPEGHLVKPVIQSLLPHRLVNGKLVHQPLTKGAFHQWSHLALKEASTWQMTIFCNFSIVMSVKADSLKRQLICERPKIEMSWGEDTNERNIHSTGNMEMMKGYLVKKFPTIVRVCDRDVFFKSACPYALGRPLLGFVHNISNLSGTPLSNGCGFTVMPHCKVNLSRNVSLQWMTLWANIIRMEII